jgi:hypothetical protein
VRRAEIGDLARRTPAGAYHLLSCLVYGLLPCARPGRAWPLFAADDNDAERDFRRRRTTEMMKT